MKNKAEIIIFLIMLAISVICIFLSIAITKAIVNANIPEWLKFWLMSL